MIKDDVECTPRIHVFLSLIIPHMPMELMKSKRHPTKIMPDTKEDREEVNDSCAATELMKTPPTMIKIHDSTKKANVKAKSTPFRPFSCCRKYLFALLSGGMMFSILRSRNRNVP